MLWVVRLPCTAAFVPVSMSTNMYKYKSSSKIMSCGVLLWLMVCNCAIYKIYSAHVQACNLQYNGRNYAAFTRQSCQHVSDCQSLSLTVSRWTWLDVTVLLSDSVRNPRRIKILCYVITYYVTNVAISQVFPLCGVTNKYVNAKQKPRHVDVNQY